MKLFEYKTKDQHYFRDEEGQIQGEYNSWYENGQKRVIAHSRDGEFHGEYKSWYLNGHQSLICHFRDGKRHGEYKNWNLMGELEIHTFEIDGKEVINFRKNPELYPSTPEEKTMFVLKYGSGPLMGEAG